VVGNLVQDVYIYGNSSSIEDS